MKLSDFDFDLPEDLIATRPVAPRSSARMLVANGDVLHDQTAIDLPEWLRELEHLDPDELLSQLREGALNWLQEFDEDLKDTRPSTLLVIFGLGVLVGKLTA